MTDREKVIKGLECCYADGTVPNCEECPYAEAEHDGTCYRLDPLLRDALALLKTQEPVKPILKREGWNKYHNDYVCPVCDQELVYEQNYCSECGSAVKWE